MGPARLIDELGHAGVSEIAEPRAELISGTAERRLREHGIPALISIAPDAGIGYPPAASASGSSRMRLWVDRKGGHLVHGESELRVCGTHFAEDIYDLTRERVGVNDRQELESGTTRV